MKRKLESISTLSYIYIRCLLKLTDNDFGSKLDSDCKILTFINGYINLNTKTFHEYYYNRFITITFPLNYTKIENTNEIEKI